MPYVTHNPGTTRDHDYDHKCTPFLLPKLIQQNIHHWLNSLIMSSQIDKQVNNIIVMVYDSTKRAIAGACSDVYSTD